MASHAPRILIVDDEPDTCANLADMANLGFEVDTANDGFAALELIAKKPYHIALFRSADGRHGWPGIVSTDPGNLQERSPLS